VSREYAMARPPMCAKQGLIGDDGVHGVINQDQHNSRILRFVLKAEEWTPQHQL
jgi:hypothetical protein